MRSLDGKAAVITGGNSGIGEATARLFVQHGARVVITGRRKDALDAAVGRIGPDAFGVAGDVADPGHHERLADEVCRRFGGADILVANAGVISLERSADVTAETYDRQFSVNTRGLFFSTQALLPAMRDGGSVVLLGSLAARKVLENHAVYAGSKAAIAAFARSWALELKARRIRVNVLSPGPVDTAILDKLGIPRAERPEFARMMAEMIPAGRLGAADEIAQAALFLASDASSFVNGIDLPVDGGMGLA